MPVASHNTPAPSASPHDIRRLAQNFLFECNSSEQCSPSLQGKTDKQVTSQVRPAQSTACPPCLTACPPTLAQDFYGLKSAATSASCADFCARRALPDSLLRSTDSPNPLFPLGSLVPGESETTESSTGGGVDFTGPGDSGVCPSHPTTRQRHLPHHMTYGASRRIFFLSATPRSSAHLLYKARQISK